MREEIIEVWSESHEQAASSSPMRKTNVVIRIFGLVIDNGLDFMLSRESVPWTIYRQKIDAVVSVENWKRSTTRSQSEGN